MKWAELPASSFYYKRAGGRKGIKPSTHSLTVRGERKDNKIIVVQMEVVLRREFCCYGYKNMTAELRELEKRRTYKNNGF